MEKTRIFCLSITVSLREAFTEAWKYFPAFFRDHFHHGDFFQRYVMLSFWDMADGHSYLATLYMNMPWSVKHSFGQMSKLNCHTLLLLTRTCNEFTKFETFSVVTRYICIWRRIIFVNQLCNVTKLRKMSVHTSFHKAKGLKKNISFYCQKYVPKIRKDNNFIKEFRATLYNIDANFDHV